MREKKIEPFLTELLIPCLRWWLKINSMSQLIVGLLMGDPDNTNSIPTVLHISRIDHSGM